MNATIQRTTDVLKELDETAQLAALRFAEFLAASDDDEYCLALYKGSFNEANGDPMPFDSFVKELGINPK